MKLIQLLNADFFVPDQLSKELSQIESLVSEEFDYKNKYIASDTASNYKNIIGLQKESADKNSHQTLGFNSLMGNLSSLDESKAIFMRMIESDSWGGRLYFIGSQQLIGVFLGKKRQKQWKTPPNWDGSQRELEEYNKHIDGSE